MLYPWFQAYFAHLGIFTLLTLRMQIETNSTVSTSSLDVSGFLSHNDYLDRVYSLKYLFENYKTDPPNQPQFCSLGQTHTDTIKFKTTQ